MRYKVFETLKYFERYDCERIKITANNIRFELLFDKYSLPHLLGLHYMYKARKINKRVMYFDENNQRMTGTKIYALIDSNTSDDEVFKKINENNPEQLKLVKDRVNTFSDFMKNLEYGYVVENTKIENLGGHVNYFVVQDDQGNYNHLGIKTENGVDVIAEYNDNISKLITYFKRNNNSYFKGSSIKENIISIEIYDRDQDTYIPFSFDQEKNERLRDDRSPRQQGMTR